MRRTALNEIFTIAVYVANKRFNFLRWSSKKSGAKQSGERGRKRAPFNQNLGIQENSV